MILIVDVNLNFTGTNLTQQLPYYYSIHENDVLTFKPVLDIIYN